MARKYGKTKVSDATNRECKHCNSLIFEKTDNSIECWECGSWFHVECTPLDRKNFNEIIDKTLSWKCQICSINNDKSEICESQSVDSNEIGVPDDEQGSENHGDNSPSFEFTPKCIRCLVNLTNSSYQQIFDENGKELGLATLLSECFEIDVKESKDEVQALCDECVNELVETYDLMQREVNFQKPGISSSILNADMIKTEVLTSDNNEDDDDDNNDGYNKNNDGDSDSDIELDNLLTNISEDALVKDIPTDEDKVKVETNVNPKNSFRNEEDENSDFENVFYLDDYDKEFDFRAYKEKVIKNHKFNEIQFPSPIECRICLEAIEDHCKIIEHTKKSHCDVNGMNRSYPCVVDETCTPLNTIEDLSFHLVFKHYDLDNLIILAECPECSQFFENFPAYNKHCCDTVKRKSRSTVECEQCGRFFKSNKRYRFHLQFHLEKRRPKACLICDKMFRDEDEFYEHIKYEHEKNIGNICKSCDLVFTTEENLTNHVTNSHSKEHVYYNCPKCMKPFSAQQHLKQHMSIHEEAKYKCHICGKCLSRKSRLNKHLVRHQNPIEKDVLTCSICGLVACDDENAEIHLIGHEESEACMDCERLSIAYVCEYCDSSFNTIENLRKHRDLHPPNEYTCAVCDAKHNKFSTISSHKLSHVKYMESLKQFPVMRHYVCEVAQCNKSYLLWTSLNLHRMKNHESRNNNFCCAKCNLSYSTYFQYKNHLTEYHDGKLIFDCNFCNKSFKIKSALTLHVKKAHKQSREEKTKVIKSEPKKKLKQSANGSESKQQISSAPKERNFKCNICGKGFFTRSDANSHEKAVHAKQVRFFCPSCDFKTPYRQTLTYHLKTHKDEYPYECSICSRKFRFKNSHKLHEQRHQNVKNFVCNMDGCRLSYINLGRLRTHQRLKHSPGAKNTKTSKRSYDMCFDAFSNTFIDDDDGLDDGVIGEPSQQLQTTIVSPVEIYKQNSNDNLVGEEIPINFDDVDDDNVDDPTEYYSVDREIEIEEKSEIIHHNDMDNVKPVLIIRNNDYIMELDHTKIYGNALEATNIQETEVGATEIVGE